MLVASPILLDPSIVTHAGAIITASAVLPPKLTTEFHSPTNISQERVYLLSESNHYDGYIIRKRRHVL